jgi:hypothetical protein
MREKAVKGTAALRVELVVVLAELDPPAVAVAAKAFSGGVSTPEEGV